jgi:hypothetical protein
MENELDKHVTRWHNTGVRGCLPAETTSPADSVLASTPATSIYAPDDQTD